ncbi:hypothetical protein [Bradyrhizobium sp. B117]|uniref:hypothetical protein n=1 Tax=Bradyrhizobium sp. B117 TaxID=3140246 RepID=UPI003182F97D
MILSELVRHSKSVLAVGTPSLARYLESIGHEVLLVDRQPIHAVRNHRQVEPGSSPPDFGKSTIAIIDPPWYPTDAKIWIAWTAHGIEPQSQMLVSLWPDTTRPTAAKEFEELKSWISQWAEFEILDVVPQYKAPLFEEAALKVSEGPSMGLSPRYGRLVSVRPRTLPVLLGHSELRSTWIRFVVDDYQLAICLKENKALTRPVVLHPLAKHWIWPYVSKRARERDLINLWSSRNEVALLRDPRLAVETLRRALKSGDPAGFRDQLGSYGQLQDLSIPRPPYRRLLEWQHQQ